MPFESCRTCEKSHDTLQRGCSLRFPSLSAARPAKSWAGFRRRPWSCRGRCRRARRRPAAALRVGHATRLPMRRAALAARSSSSVRRCCRCMWAIIISHRSVRPPPPVCARSPRLVVVWAEMKPRGSAHRPYAPDLSARVTPPARLGSRQTRRSVRVRPTQRVPVAANLKSGGTAVRPWGRSAVGGKSFKAHKQPIGPVPRAHERGRPIPRVSAPLGCCPGDGSRHAG